MAGSCADGWHHLGATVGCRSRDISVPMHTQEWTHGGYFSSDQHSLLSLSKHQGGWGEGVCWSGHKSKWVCKGSRLCISKHSIVFGGAMAGWPVHWRHYLHHCVKTTARVWRQRYISYWRLLGPHVCWIFRNALCVLWYILAGELETSQICLTFIIKSLRRAKDAKKKARFKDSWSSSCSQFSYFIQWLICSLKYTPNLIIPLIIEIRLKKYSVGE